MRIGLLVSNVLYPLAGQAGVSERLFSSASNIRIQEEIEVQTAAYVRSENARSRDRKNLRVELGFETVRTFSTAAAARVWAQDYSSSMPRSGTIMVDDPGDNSAPVSYIIGSASGAPLLDVSGAPVSFPILMKASATRYSSNGGSKPASGAWYTLENSGPENEGWIIGAYDGASYLAGWESLDSGTAPEEIDWSGTGAGLTTGTPVPVPVRSNTRFITHAVVHPPERRLNGASVALYYRVSGSAQTTSF